MPDPSRQPFPLPDVIDTEPLLDEVMSSPTDDLIEVMAGLRGDLAILGVGGKMGHTLARMAVRAVDAAGCDVRILGVSRFSDPQVRKQLEEYGVRTIACDLLDRDAVTELPPAENVIFMAGRKFGTSGSEELTWAMNTLVPANVAEHYRESRIVAFSTGCVYPMVDVKGGGSTEDDPTGPVGEYSQSCLGRERVFEHYSKRFGTPMCLYRLNYSIDLRYGVLYDLANRVWRGEEIDLSMGHVNVIWQGDACRYALRALGRCASPAAVLNVTGAETLTVRDVATRLGELLGRDVRLVGRPASTALLNNASRTIRRFGPPRVDTDTMLRWTAHWVRCGGRSLDKPTHFEERGGQF